MREQLELMISIDQAANFSSTVGTRLSKHFDKGLSIMLKAVPLIDVKRMSGSDRSRLARKMQLALTRNELKSVSKLWEKDRTIDNEESHSELSENLKSLMMGVREPYRKPPAALTLKKAREMSLSDQAKLKTDLRDWAPGAHLKSLLKKWDKHNPSVLTASRNTQVSHLIALLDDNSTPSPKPPKR